MASTHKLRGDASIDDDSAEANRADEAFVPLGRAIAAPLATLSVAAAAIHFAVGPVHVVEYEPYGYAFLALAWFQALWAVGHAVRPNRFANLAAIVINAGAAVVWAWSRAVGLPFGPEPGVPEAVGSLDVVATVEELFLAGLLVTLALRPVREAVGQVVLRPASAWIGVALWCGLILVVTSYVLLQPQPIMMMM